MLRLLSAILALAVAGLGYFAWQLHGETVSLRGQVAALTSERDAALSAKAVAQKEIEPLKENNARLQSERDEAKKKIAAASQATPAVVEPAGVAPQSTAADAAADGVKGMAKIFQTEEGKKMMKTQMAMGTKMAYRDLARVLKLSPQEAEQAMALLTDRQSAMAGDPWELLSGGEISEAKLKELGAKSEAAKKEYDEKLKAVLGEEKFKALKDYDNTLGDRMMLTQHEQGFTAAGVPLEGEQREQLLQIMSQERAKSPPSIFDHSGVDAGKNLRALEDDGAIDKWIQQEKEYHRRVLDAAPKVLNPEQIVAFQQGLDQTIEMQKFGIKMSKEMFKKGGAAAPK